MARKNDRTYSVLSTDVDAVDLWLEVSTGQETVHAGRLACEKWIKEYGAPTKIYQVAVVAGPPISVNVEKIEKRTLGPAAAPEPDQQAASDRAAEDEATRLDGAREEREE